MSDQVEGLEMTARDRRIEALRLIAHGEPVEP